jgi:branched-chain amino acid transport system ATP-binding protein
VTLAVRSVTKTFGGLTALDGISFEVAPGEAFGIIGPNGAGKTTLLNVISGFYPPDGGEVRHRGADLTGKPLRAVARRGIVRTFQLTEGFPELTVRENLEVACHLRARPSFLHEICASRRARRAAAAEAQLADELAATVGLEGYEETRASLLPYGLKKALAIGMALASDPQVVLLDEPVAGMDDSELALMRSNIAALGARGLTAIVVEHNMPFIMDVCDRILVLHFGRVLAQGAPAQVRGDPAVIDAYLGTAR